MSYLITSTFALISFPVARVLYTCNLKEEMVSLACGFSLWSASSKTESSWWSQIAHFMVAGKQSMVEEWQGARALQRQVPKDPPCPARPSPVKAHCCEGQCIICLLMSKCPVIQVPSQESPKIVKVTIKWNHMIFNSLCDSINIAHS